MTFPLVELSPLPPNTIVPEEELLFVPYLNRLYEDIAFAVNERDNGSFVISISNVPVSITNMPNLGAFLFAASGLEDGPTPPAVSTATAPTITASLCKSSATGAGQVVVLGSQVGSGIWAGINLTITSTATNFQIAHNLTDVAADFSIRICGTQ